MTYSEHNGTYLIRFMPNEEWQLFTAVCVDHKITGGW